MDKDTIFQLMEKAILQKQEDIHDNEEGVEALEEIMQLLSSLVEKV